MCGREQEAVVGFRQGQLVGWKGGRGGSLSGNTMVTVFQSKYVDFGWNKKLPGLPSVGTLEVREVNQAQEARTPSLT